MWDGEFELELSSLSNRMNVFYLFITCRAKLLNTDWLKQRAFFINHERTFWLSRGHDYLMLIEPFCCLWQLFIDCNLNE